MKWLSELRNVEKNPIIRTYALHKNDFYFEPYLDAISDTRYRSALTKLRASSHTLEIERGRYNVPKTPVSDRLCLVCNEVEDEIHFFLTKCQSYSSLRDELFEKIYSMIPAFRHFNGKEKYVFLMTTRNKQLVVWLGKFVFKIFGKRGQFTLKTRFTIRPAD